MNEPTIYAAFETAALTHAVEILRKHGLRIVSTPTPDVTHLLLPVPSPKELQPVLRQLSPTVTIVGGNLTIPSYQCIDLLKDEHYLFKNARITAHIALSIALQKLPIIIEGCPVLILGYGRIGKCLAQLLRDVGADVTIAARKRSDLAMAEAMGYASTDINALGYILRRYRVIFNTVPHPVLSQEQQTNCHANCVKIDLASSPGIAGDTIQARGLPGKYAPESSGKLIAQTVLRLLAEQEVRQ